MIILTIPRCGFVKKQSEHRSFFTQSKGSSVAQYPGFLERFLPFPAYMRRFDWVFFRGPDKFSDEHLHWPPKQADTARDLSRHGKTGSIVPASTKLRCLSSSAYRSRNLVSITVSILDGLPVSAVSASARKRKPKRSLSPVRSERLSK